MKIEDIVLGKEYVISTPHTTDDDTSLEELIGSTFVPDMKIADQPKDMQDFMFAITAGEGDGDIKDALLGTWQGEDLMMYADELSDPDA